MNSLLLFIHIAGAVIGLLSGAMAMVVRKGSGLHTAAGNIFFIDMIFMTLSAAYLAAFVKPVTINVIVGLLTFYLVVTGWRAARRRVGGTTLFDVGAFLFVLANGGTAIALGSKFAIAHVAMKNGVPTPMYFIFGSIALLFAAGDVRMLMRGGVIGARRIARHLWRMSFALLITAFSLWPGRPQVFPESWRKSNLLYVPLVLLIGAMLFYLVRTRFPRRGRIARHEGLPAAHLVR